MIYVLVTMSVNPEETEALKFYKDRAKEIRGEYGVEVVKRFDVIERLAGNFEDESIRILKFPSVEHVKNWLSDPRYLEIIPYRDRGYNNVTVSILKDLGS